MKFDKETIAALLLCIGLVAAWGIYSKKALEEKAKLQGRTPAVAKGVEPVESAMPKTDEPKQTATVQAEKAPLPATEGLQPTEKNTERALDASSFAVESIGNDVISCDISPYDSSIRSVGFGKFLDRTRKARISFGGSGMPFDALKVELGLPSDVLDVKVEKNDGKLKISRKLAVTGSTLELVQTFSVGEGYVVDSELTAKNTGETKISMPSFKISAGGISDFKHIAGDQLQSEYFSIDSCMAAGGAVKARPFNGKNIDEMQENPARWIALSNKYFCSMLLPGEPFLEGNTLKAIAPENKADPTAPYISSAGVNVLNLNPGESRTLSFALYVGPKERALLKGFDESATKIMHLGWSWLDPISQLLLSFLVLLNKHVANYGLSIIILTVLVKLVFWPVTEKANASMKKMQKLQPMVQEIKEKHKNDPQKMNAKVMALYKEHGVNPLGGCLPILLQIPVFFALYNTLNGAVELRQASFLWATDLSRPDSLFIPGIPIPINPLVLAMSGTMFLQQKMTPTSADPMQQKIMAFMPLIMLFMLYSLPSGLTLYWTVSQAISILQLATSKYMPLLRKEKGTA